MKARYAAGVGPPARRCSASSPQQQQRGPPGSKACTPRKQLPAQAPASARAAKRDPESDPESDPENLILTSRKVRRASAPASAAKRPRNPCATSSAAAASLRATESVPTFWWPGRRGGSGGGTAGVAAGVKGSTCCAGSARCKPASARKTHSAGAQHRLPKPPFSCEPGACTTGEQKSAVALPPRPPARPPARPPRVAPMESEEAPRKQGADHTAVPSGLVPSLTMV